MTKVMHNPNKNISSCLPRKHLINHCTKISLPEEFPHVNPPQFEIGDRLRWIPLEENTNQIQNFNLDWGMVIGRFYSYAPEQKSWSWCYLIYLDKTAKSAPWCQFDTAWEEDLESLDDE